MNLELNLESLPPEWFVDGWIVEGGRRDLVDQTLHEYAPMFNVIGYALTHWSNPQLLAVDKGDSLAAPSATRYQVVLTNPPFGRKSSVLYINEEGQEERDDLTVVREDFWATTSNKQLNFVQHVHTMLDMNGRAAVVVPDNVLFEGGAGETVRRRLLQQCDVHTLLRLPTGVFYAQGVKANVLFFDRKPGRDKAWTEKLWIYDLRTNMHFTLKTNPLKRTDLDEFVECFNPANRHDRKPTWSEENPAGRWRAYDYDELLQRDKASLDIFWLRDESLEDTANLPDPDVIAAEIADDLRTALEEFEAIQGDLGIAKTQDYARRTLTTLIDTLGPQLTTRIIRPVIDFKLVPTEEQIYVWIEEVFRQGVRRPGYPADRWAEEWLQEQLRSFGLENVRAEPVETPYWEPLESSLRITSPDRANVEIPCFALPFSLPGEIEAPLVHADGEQVRGSVAMRNFKLLSVPHSWYGRIATWQFDPDNSFSGANHLLPFAQEVQGVMEPAIEAGAAGFIGVLEGYPGDSLDYYVPYDAKWRSIPGVWVRGSDGEYLKSVLALGAASARIRVEARRETTTCFSIVGELPGVDDGVVIIGSHHDGPWSSAVEDGSGISLVLAQAAYWSRLPRSYRPHRLQFVLNCGHMAGGAGQSAFVRTHREELDRVVLEVHLEHAAVEIAEVDGELRPTGRPEARWWFTSRIPRLEAAVREAIRAEDLRRSYILPPTAFGEKPTTDGADFHLAGVPLVNYLTAPFYLFDAMDTLDKIHRPSLVPITRAAIRIVNSTAGVSAATMRTTQT